MQVGDFRGAFYGLLVNLVGGYTKDNIGGHAVIGQVDVLRHIANGALPLAAVGGGDGFAVDAQVTVLRLEQPKDDIHRGGFTAAGGAHKANGAMRGDGQINILERGMRCIGVAVTNLLQGNGVLQRHGRAVGGRRIGGLQAGEIGMQGIERRAGKAQLRDRAIDLLQRRHQAIAGKGIERDDGQRSGKTAASGHQI
jgi:hypothetical protein